MNEAAHTVSLASLDEPRDATLEPAVRARNLAALHESQPDLAAQLEPAVPPADWRLVLALDETRTYRIETPGQPPQWLGGTAAPRTRARGILHRLAPSSRNVALPELFTGTELIHLLDVLPRHQAIFVFVADLRELVAFLQVHDVSDAVRIGRCVFLPPETAARALAALLAQHPGLAPPATILLADLADGPRVALVKQVCETVGAATHQARTAQLQSLGAAPASARPLPEQPRTAILSLLPSDASHRMARGAASGACALGWDTLLRTTTGPRDIDALPHCAALHAFAPDLTLCIAHPRSLLPLPASGLVGTWFLHAAQLPTTLAEENALCLAGSPQIARVLRARFPHRRVLECFAAVPDDVPADDERAFRQADTIVVVGDLPDVTPQTYHIEESTHQRLWRRLIERAHDAWQSSAVPAPDALLSQAVRDTGVTLRDPPLRESFAQLVQEVCLPGAAWEDITRTIRQAGFRIVAVGQGWARLADDHLRPFATDLLALPDAQWPAPPAACVIAGRQDPLAPTTLLAAARGWPLMLQDAGRATLADELGGVLASENHFAPFADTVELRAALKCLRTDPDTVQARVVHARGHVRRAHTFARRLQELVMALRT